MRYSALNGGKRVRAALVYASAEAISGENLPGACDAPACAVELIHAYSLVHDDLPAMDDDALRRGQPTCHIAFDEATAILAGDALQTLAFGCLASDSQLTADLRCQLISVLASASGHSGMVAGQDMDLAAEDNTINLDELESLHIHKTGALIRASVTMGALVAGATPDQLATLHQFSDAIGLAFQVQDDILDIEGSTESLGKAQGADLALNKSTYPSLIGLDAAKERAAALECEALVALDAFGEKGAHLRTLARFIVERKS
jgi:farnesyl diphosphate synthase/geranylgeranyl diphosphate synthase type II